MNREERDAAEERERMPCIQVEADLWIVMREAKDRPRAVIERVRWHDGSEQYLLKTWHTNPAERRLVRIHDSIEDANRSVKWRGDSPEEAARKTPRRDGYPLEEIERKWTQESPPRSAPGRSERGGESAGQVRGS